MIFLVTWTSPSINDSSRSKSTILSLEHYKDGQAIKADILDHPVAFNKNELKHVDTSEEALAASLNKHGNVNLEYMASLADKSQDTLLDDLKRRVFFNPLIRNYEITDKFISGNVISKAEMIEEYITKHPDNECAKESLEALRAAFPVPIPFEELDFNFGERWIPTGIYEKDASHLFDTDVKINYAASRDEFSIHAIFPFRFHIIIFTFTIYCITIYRITTYRRIQTFLHIRFYICFRFQILFRFCIYSCSRCICFPLCRFCLYNPICRYCLINHYSHFYRYILVYRCNPINHCPIDRFSSNFINFYFYITPEQFFLFRLQSFQSVI